MEVVRSLRQEEAVLRGAIEAQEGAISWSSFEVLSVGVFRTGLLCSTLE
jgi:hypothetical protein